MIVLSFDFKGDDAIVRTTMVPPDRPLPT